MACPTVSHLLQVWVTFRRACGGALVEGSCGAGAKGFPGMGWPEAARLCHAVPGGMAGSDPQVAGGEVMAQVQIIVFHPVQ